MSNLFNKLSAATIISEEPLAGIDRKQRSITKLFPSFDDRVKAVGKAGGIELENEEPGVWYFKSSSVTQAPGQKIYDIIVKFSDIEKQILRLAQDQRLWKADKSGLDLKKLATEIFDEADVKISCNCPAAKYWGFDYIQTKRRTKAGDPETRRPRIRNPHEYGVACKHIQAVLDTLPFYKGTLASHLKRFYSKEVAEAEKSVRRMQKGLHAGTEFLKKREAELKQSAKKPAIKATRPPREPEPPKEEEPPEEPPKPIKTPPKPPKPVKTQAKPKPKAPPGYARGGMPVIP